MSTCIINQNKSDPPSAKKRDRLCQTLIQAKNIMTQQTLEAQVASSKLKRSTISNEFILQPVKPIVDSK